MEVKVVVVMSLVVSGVECVMWWVVKYNINV